MSANAKARFLEVFDFLTAVDEAAKQKPAALADLIRIELRFGLFGATERDALAARIETPRRATWSTAT